MSVSSDIHSLPIGVCLSVCLSACLYVPVCLSVCVYVCVFVSVQVRQSFKIMDYSLLLGVHRMSDPAPGERHMSDVPAVVASINSSLHWHHHLCHHQ